MTRQSKYVEPEFAIQDKPPKRKILRLEMAVNADELEEKIKKAFDLSQSAGHVLEITFHQAAP